MVRGNTSDFHPFQATLGPVRTASRRGLHPAAASPRCKRRHAAAPRLCAVFPQARNHLTPKELTKVYRSALKDAVLLLKNHIIFQ